MVSFPYLEAPNRPLKKSHSCKKRVEQTFRFRVYVFISDIRSRLHSLLKNFRIVMTG